VSELPRDLKMANPRPRSRPARYALAAVIAGVLVLVMIANSFLDYAYLDTIAGRASLFGLLAVALVALATFIAVRVVDRDPRVRRRHAIRAGVLLGLATLLWLLVSDFFLFARSAGPGVAAVCALVCLPTTGFGLLVVRRLDRNEKEPWRLVLVAAAWGAIVATSLVIWGESFWQAIAERTLVPGPGLDASTAFSAGLLEELGKGSAVVLLFLVMRNEFDDVVDGIVYGAAVGLGFNFMESITYMTNLYAIFTPEHSAAVAAGFQWYARQVLGLFMGHATYTAFVGAGVGIARQLPTAPKKITAIVAGFVVAIAAHFSWDAWLTFFPVSASFPLGLIEVHLRTLAMTGPFTVAVVVLLAMGLRNESVALSEQLRAEAAEARGTVLPQEVAILMSPWQRFVERWRALDRKGLGAYLRVGRLQAAQLDLAMERWHRARREIDTPLEAEEELRRKVLALRQQAAF
jgi:RsiW-degrading membrane proteinase PrsW (M82 family)